MARGINKVILVGNLGDDPDVRSTQSGATVSRIRVATSDQWKDKDSGERQERTEWHTVVFFGRLAEVVAEYLTKGRQVYIEGRLQTSKWQDQEGNDRYSTDIIAREMQMLGGGSHGTQEQRAAERSHEAREPKEKELALADGDPDDDIPF